MRRNLLNNILRHWAVIVFSAHVYGRSQFAANPLSLIYLGWYILTKYLVNLIDIYQSSVKINKNLCYDSLSNILLTKI